MSPSASDTADTLSPTVGKGKAPAPASQPPGSKEAGPSDASPTPSPIDPLQRMRVVGRRGRENAGGDPRQIASPASREGEEETCPPGDEIQQASHVLERDQKAVEQLTDDVKVARNALLGLANELDAALNSYQEHYEKLKSLLE
ncbi:hypothetical protein PG984_011221 [Apiospora sp. TS-2023a]